MIVSEPNPQKIEKEGLVNGQSWRCTLHPVCRCTSDWLPISILMCDEMLTAQSRLHKRPDVFRCSRKLWTPSGKIRTLEVTLSPAEGSTDGGRFSNLIIFRSVHFHTGPFTRPSFPFLREGLSGNETAPMSYDD